ncbi:MAG: RNA polymerase sigma factor [Bacteroidales bacterium]|nr:RNA polymerase sigma factor [Candidatus Sodaliphilus fimicaballi]
MTREQFIGHVKREQGALMRFLLALCCGNRDDAGDIAQETLIKAYIALDRYDEREHFAAWIRRIAYNTFINHRKKRQREATQPIEQARHITGGQEADSTFVGEELHRALAALPHSERTAIVLHYIEGFKINEITQITGCSEAAVKKQLQRGREELKRRIKR